MAPSTAAAARGPHGAPAGPTSPQPAAVEPAAADRATGPLRPMHARWLGRIGYSAALELQERLHADAVAGAPADTLLLLEHDPVITLGRQSSDAHVLASPEALAARGIAVHQSGRGGDVTYHGPGQLVGYPIVALGEGERDVRRYVHALEQVLIDTAADFGVVAERVDGLRGIWVGNDKLAAIGIRLSRWATLHGFALNVTTDLDDFGTIVPCGLHGRGVTSLQRACRVAPSMAQVRERVLVHAGAALRRTIISED
jgi:lipoyl(octanoyl) transferase